MKVYIVLTIEGGIPNVVGTFTDKDAALERFYEYAPSEDADAEWEYDENWNTYVSYAVNYNGDEVRICESEVAA